MIDTKELRRLAQDATPWRWYVGTGTYEGRNIYSANAITDSEGFTYQPVIATAEDNDIQHWDANASFIAAANPAAISELLDRLEAAEKERDATRAMLRAALDVLEEVKGNINPERWPTTAVNGGWKLVPRPPTPTMVKAGLESSHVLNVHRVLACYDAMIDAAPEAKP